MKPDDIVLLGVKHSVLAFQKMTGERLWSANLASGLGNGFVSLIADDKKVYAHSGGKLFCLDLFSGRELWHDGLSGYGYGIASLAVPGIHPSSTPPAYAAKQQADASSAAATTVTSS
jgi:outer membrane protein assembly factor BamB